MTKKISIVTPTFNEDLNIERLCLEIAQQMKSLNYDYEHIVIDNLSTDSTAQILEKITKTDKNLKVIINNRNFGHIRSPIHGLLQASGDAVILMSADFQDPISLIPKYIEEWEKGHMVVMGQKTTSDESKFKHYFKKLYYKFINAISEVPLLMDTTGAGLFDRKIIEELRNVNDPYPYFRGLIQEFGYSISTIDYLQPRRIRGVTKNNFYTLYDMAMLGMISHSILPIRLASMLGFFIGFISFILALAVLVAKLVWWESFIGGQAGLLILILLLFGTLLIFIGMLGEYVGSIHNYLKNRPIVVEKERVNFNNDKGD